MFNKLIKGTPIFRRWMCLFAFVAFSACVPDNTEYTSRYQCFFVFDCTMHNTSLILACVNPVSPGTFAMVRKDMSGAAIDINVSLYGGQQQTDKITTAEELRRSCILGANNALIIGCSSLNNGELYAFDHQCPNCLDENYPLTKYPLTWDNNGQWVKCSTCNRSYDLNNGGYIAKGQNGMKLVRYRASFTGNMLRVQNN